MKEISKKLLDKKYFIFDLDGTLVDSMPMWNLIDQAAIFDVSGITVPEEEIKAIRDSVLYSENNLHGNIYELFYAELIKLFNLDTTVKDFREKRHEYANYMSTEWLDYKAGAGEFLRLIKDTGKKIGIATTTTKNQFDLYSNHNKKIKAKADLGKIVDSIVVCEDVTFKKPHPEAYQKVISLLGANPEECIVFEDSLAGVMAAKDAGLEVCSVYDKTAEPEQDMIAQLADYSVESFDELIKALELEECLANMKIQTTF